MAQFDVYEYLAKRRLCGDNGFLTYKEVYKDLREKMSYRALCQNVRSLSNGGYIDLWNDDPFYVRFRLKKKYVLRYKKFNGDSLGRR